MAGFRYLLKLEDEEPADPPAFVTKAIPTWKVGDTFLARIRARLLQNP